MKFHNNIPISGWSFSNFSKEKIPIFDRLLEIFKELLTYTSGDFDEAIDWLKELDKEYELTNDDYSIEDFINDLLKRGFISSEISTGPNKELLKITAKMEKALRKFALKKIFGQIKKSKQGNHKSKSSGSNDEDLSDFKSFEFGDPVDKIIFSESLKNMYTRTGSDELNLISDDIVVSNGYLKKKKK